MHWTRNNLAEQARASIYRCFERRLRIWKGSAGGRREEEVTGASAIVAFIVAKPPAMDRLPITVHCDVVTSLSTWHGRRTVSSADASVTDRGGTRRPVWPATGFTPPRIFSPCPDVISQAGENCGGKSPVSSSRHRRFFGHCTMEILIRSSDRTIWRTSFSIFHVTIHSLACINFVVQGTNYNFVTKILLRHPLNSPQFDLQVLPISLVVIIQSLVVTDSPFSCQFISHFYIASMLSHLRKVILLS